MIFQQLSGVNTLIFYAKKIFDDAGSTLSSSTSSVIVGAVQVVATYCSTILIERAGRKLLLFISVSVMATCMFTLSGYFHFQVKRLIRYYYKLYVININLCNYINILSHKF